LKEVNYRLSCSDLLASKTIKHRNTYASGVGESHLTKTATSLTHQMQWLYRLLLKVTVHEIAQRLWLR
jgi:hypothetical protein